MVSTFFSCRHASYEARSEGEVCFGNFENTAGRIAKTVSRPRVSQSCGKSQGMAAAPEAGSLESFGQDPFSSFPMIPSVMLFSNLSLQVTRHVRYVKCQLITREVSENNTTCSFQEVLQPPSEGHLLTSFLYAVEFIVQFSQCRLSSRLFYCRI